MGTRQSVFIENLLIFNSENFAFKFEWFNFARNNLMNFFHLKFVIENLIKTNKQIVKIY